MIFKNFANIDAYDIEINATDPDKLIEIVAAISPTFGGINLEDIKAPECFYIEEKLQSMLDIPVFHDDQHGTAITVAAALINAVKVQNKTLNNIKIVIQGAGASALACGKLLVEIGLNKSQLIFLDSKGILSNSRNDLNKYKQEFSIATDKTKLYEAIIGADVFIDLAGAMVENPKKMIQSMNVNPILFTLSNPTPCIDRGLIKDIAPNAIIATGLSNLPNQVNNVICYPYLFRGALNCKAKKITTKMKIAATYSIAKIAFTNSNLGPNYILPQPYDPLLLQQVPIAVAQAYSE